MARDSGMSEPGRGDVGVKESACGPHTTQLTRFGLSNCYLVAEDDGLTLVDTSLRGSAGEILAAAARIGRPIRRIAITHAHHDHAGALESLMECVPEAELAVGARESRLLRGDLTPQAGEPRGRLRGYLYEQAEVTPARLLAAGDRIGSLEVIAAPGHTPGHIGFLDTRDRTLLAGDAYIAVGELFVTTELVWRFPFPALSGTWHAPTAIEAAQRLSDLEPARIATGHGRIVEEPADEIARALRRARERKAWG